MNKRSIERRVEKLEKTTGAGKHDDIRVKINDCPVTMVISWDDDQTYYEFGNERLPKAEFYRRYPDFKFDDELDLSVNWEEK